MFKMTAHLDARQKLQLAIAETQLHLDQGDYQIALLHLDLSTQLLSDTAYQNAQYYEIKAQLRELRDTITDKMNLSAPPPTPTASPKR